MATKTFAATDVNDKPTLTAVSNTDSTVIVRLTADPVTGALLVTTSGSGATFTNNEVVGGSGTTWTLAATPVAGTEHIFANGQRLTPGGVDYTIAGAVVTTVNSWSAGTVLADYQTS